MSRRKNVLMVTTGILIGLLMASTAAHAAEAPPIRVSSYKGAVLEVGERSGLVIGPSGSGVHGDLQRPGHGGGGTGDELLGGRCQVRGECGDHRLQPGRGNRRPDADRGAKRTVGPTTGDSPDQREVSDVRLELVRLVNETRRENGAAELTVNEA